MRGPFFGTVIHGLHNGEGFGFPTANVQLCHPADIELGVYAVTLQVEEQHLRGMMYVGTRPTLNLSELSLEIHLFDFQGDLYGKSVSFTIIGKIRDEIRFNSTDELIQQLHQDKKSAMQMLTLLNHN